ncbi:SusD/RagB family nutrient-binding outer membrane lipoprotein [Chitinophaga silvatica]|uniref:SusD/RagB family nutrient-binding outer membrane lipoprotein n=1 Tax=Chitinophaga silvatica TaxID=2282649 RepID=A0A3E1Y8J1_9BACT|nr:SusD/RagB family nutrient-binding outer membrane lipoprotein [Chitinophaga silvatica]RFS21725.1 SusD/RagB family nutrient-binding outer membrane lipoprotein [Chitinophaga silvatica]
MKLISKSIILCAGLLSFSVTSCKKDLLKYNVNPNGSNPGTINPNLVLSTVLTQAGIEIVTLGYQDMAGVMQHTQKDGWTTAHNEYDWNGSNSWTNYYDILRNNQLVYDRAVSLNNELQQGVSLVIKSMMFGLITDLWGDAPYTQALKGQLGGAETTPVYDPQQVIYNGILADLEKANTLLSKSKSEYINPIDAVDVYYKGDPTKWRKMANSLALRYYMRLSEKLPEVARAGIEKIVADPAKFPIIADAADDATMEFPGNSNADSWPANAIYDSDSSNYRRLKMCNTLVTYLQSLKDPRLGVWANKVQCFIVVDNNLPTGTGNVYKPVDTVVNGENRKVRYVSPDVLASKGLTVNDINQNVDYVGLPPAIPGPAVYNLSPDAAQASRNPHVSWLNDIYKQAKGPLLRARLISAAEVHFILAEASGIKGWAAGDAETHYNAAIKASFTTWGLAGSYNAYISQAAVKYNHTQRQIIEQKWAASWTAAAEAWADYKRTGYPQLKAGPYAKGPVVPVRLYYMLDERNLNKTNLGEALKRLEVTTYSSYGANTAQNSPWSKPWVIQGTGKPW